MKKYFTVIANTDYLSSWKSKGLSAETIKYPTTSDNSLTTVLSYYVYNNLECHTLMEL